MTKFVATKMGQTLSPPKTHHNHGVIRKLLSRTASTKTFVATTTTKTCVRSQTKTTKKYAAASNRKKRAAFANEDLPFCSQTVQPRSRFPTRFEFGVVQKRVNLVDLVKSFHASISIKPRLGLSKFAEIRQMLEKQ